MRGELQVTSEPGKGSTFSLFLPLQPADPAQPGSIEAADSGLPRLSGLRLLAAEDVDINRLILEDLLVEEGAQVTFAEHGRQAVELVNASPAQFDLVLMDIQMPVMDGYQATRLIRQLRADLPVIALTAHALEEERELCLEAGMCERVTKPVDPEQLITTILRVLGPKYRG